MADNSVIAEFLVSLGYAVDTSSERRATASAARVQRAVTAADKGTTQTQTIEAARRLMAMAREHTTKLELAGKAAQVAQRARKQADGDERAAVERDRAAQGRSEANRKRLEDAQRAVAGFAIGLTAAAVAAQAAYLRIVGGLDQMQFASARTGASVSNIEGLSYAFRQLGGTSAQAVGAIEGFARAMRTNPGIQGFVKSLGVGLTDAKGKARDTADVLTDSIDAIRAKHPYYTGAQMAELLGVPEDTFHILDKYADDRKKYERERREVLKAIGLDEKEASESATKFMQAMRSLGMVGEVVGKKIASDVAPAFTQFIEGIRDWIAAHPEEIKQAFENIKDAVVGVSQGLNDVFKTLEPVANGFTHIAESLTGEQGATAAFRTLGWVLGTLVIARLLGVLGLLGRLNVLKLPVWLLRLLGISGTAIAAAVAAGTIGADKMTPNAEKPGLQKHWDDDAAGGPGVGEMASRAFGWVKRKLGFGGGKGRGATGDPGPAPAGLLDNIARAEGTAGRPDKGYNTSLGYGRFLPGGTEQDLTSKSLREILDLGTYMRQQPGNPNSSALGRYQIVGSTLKDAAAALNMDLDKTKFSAETQDRMAHWIARHQGLGAWEGFKGRPNERAAAQAALDRNDTAAGGTTQPVTGSKEVVGGAHPLDGGGTFSSDYGMRHHPIHDDMRMHKGIDLKAPAGTNVKSMTDGVVSIGSHGDITVKQNNGTSTVYRHVLPSVTDGARVAAGQLIAQLKASDPRSTGPHLHFEVRDAKGNPIDPKGLLAPKPKPQSEAPVAQAPAVMASPVPTPAPRPPAPVPAPEPPRRFWIDPPKKSGNGRGKEMDDTIHLPEITVPKAASPLGANSMNMDNRKSTSIKGGDTTITITGVKDPEKAAAHVGRAVDQSSERNLRNAQTAIR